MRSEALAVQLAVQEEQALYAAQAGALDVLDLTAEDDELDGQEAPPGQVGRIQPYVFGQLLDHAACLARHASPHWCMR